MNRMTKQIMTEEKWVFHQVHQTSTEVKNGCFRYQVLPKPFLRKFLRHSGSGFQAVQYPPVHCSNVGGGSAIQHRTCLRQESKGWMDGMRVSLGYNRQHQDGISY